MPTKKELFFHIEETSPHLLPMERLAEYLKQLAILMGSTSNVHFLRVEEGSANCAIEIDETEESRILNRVQAVKREAGPQEAIEAHRALLSMLEEDGRPAELELENGAVILDFPLIRANEPQTYGPFWQDGSFDGVLVKIGGLDETIPVHLAEYGKYHTCNTTREIAKELAVYLFGNPIRVYGRGRWIRHSNGKWEMTWFNIDRFEKLDDSSLPEVVSRLRSIPGNELMSLEDPLKEMRKIRHGED